jgi:RNA polymerase sigma-54 factor
MRLNPLLDEEDDRLYRTGVMALDRDTIDASVYEGTLNLMVAPVLEMDREIMEPMEGLDVEFDAHFTEDNTAPTQPVMDVEQEAGRPSLYEALHLQLERLDLSDQERPLAEALLNELNPNGYLDRPLEAIAKEKGVSATQLEALLKRLQEEFEPAGVCARTPQEALIIQLWRRGGEETLGYRILWSHFDDLLHGRWRHIGQQLQCSVAEVERAVHEEIAPLTLRLSGSYGTSFTLPLVPDLILENGQVRLNDEPLPHLAISQVGVKWLEEGCTPTEKRYLEQQLSQAKRLLQAYEQRNQTLLRIGGYLADIQAAYLTLGGQLQPLTFRHVAQALQLPLTTIQRAVAGKMIATPRGILPLRALFTNGYASQQGVAVSAQTIRTWIQHWITAESSSKPLSDSQISTLLAEKGISCSRRTVAKYRSQLHIPGTAERRKRT